MTSRQGERGRAFAQEKKQSHAPARGTSARTMRGCRSRGRGRKRARCPAAGSCRRRAPTGRWCKARARRRGTSGRQWPGAAHVRPRQPRAGRSGRIGLVCIWEKHGQVVSDPCEPAHSGGRRSQETKLERVTGRERNNGPQERDRGSHLVQRAGSPDLVRIDVAPVRRRINRARLYAHYPPAHCQKTRANANSRSVPICPVCFNARTKAPKLNRTQRPGVQQ